MIMLLLHYNDNIQYPPRKDPAYDKLYKIQPQKNSRNNCPKYLFLTKIYSWMSHLFRSLAGWSSSRLSPAKGVKLYKLCDRALEYISAFLVY